MSPAPPLRNQHGEKERGWGVWLLVSTPGCWGDLESVPSPLPVQTELDLDASHHISLS